MAISDSEWNTIQERYNHKCAYCGREAYPLVREHQIPRKRGGADSMENIVPSCFVCNSRKGQRTPGEFAAYLVVVAQKETEKKAAAERRDQIRVTRIQEREKQRQTSRSSVALSRVVPLPVEVHDRMDEELLTAADAGRLVGVSRQLVGYWRRQGWLQAHPTNIRGVAGYRESEVRAVAAMAKTAGWPRGRPRRPEGASE